MAYNKLIRIWPTLQITSMFTRTRIAVNIHVDRQEQKRRRSGGSWERGYMCRRAWIVIYFARCRQQCFGKAHNLMHRWNDTAPLHNNVCLSRALFSEPYKLRLTCLIIRSVNYSWGLGSGFRVRVKKTFCCQISQIGWFPTAPTFGGF
jgi:hypothetical protein